MFFGNLQVTHIKGPILEETHSYPFGLTMHGISSKAVGGLGNKRKFNEGSELQSKEFSDGSGLDWYDVNARFYDPQLGRFMQVDPKPEEADQESWGPYQYALNDPILHNDPDGEVWNWVVGAVVGAAVDYGTQVVSNLASGKSIGQSLTEVDGGSIVKSAAIGAVTSGTSALAGKAVNKIGSSVVNKLQPTVTKVVQRNASSLPKNIDKITKPTINQNKQLTHIKDSPASLNRIKSNKPTSTFPNKKIADYTTRKTYEQGKVVRTNPDGTKVLEHNFKAPVGTTPNGGV